MTNQRQGTQCVHQKSSSLRPAHVHLGHAVERLLILRGHVRVTGPVPSLVDGPLLAGAKGRQQSHFYDTHSSQPPARQEPGRRGRPVGGKGPVSQLPCRLLDLLDGEAVVVVRKGGVQDGDVRVPELRLQRRRVGRVERPAGCLTIWGKKTNTPRRST